MSWFHSKKSFLKAARENDMGEVTHCLAYCIPFKFGIDVQDAQGLTALNHAARLGNAAMVRALLENGADPEITDNEGVTPLMAAAQNARSQAALALVASGAKPDTHNAEYVYPLHLAAFSGDLDLVRALAEAQADINATILTNGRTALHWAVDKDHGRVIEYLLEKGARADVADKAGKTAPELARTKGLPHLVKLFQSAAPQPAAAVAPAEGWVRSGASRLSYTGTYPEIGRKLTEIFNFESRERIVISENLKTGAETLAPPESFDTLSEEALRRALAEFRRLGGTADDAFVLGGKAIKKSLQL
jgi:uncharacterized protein